MYSGSISATAPNYTAQCVAAAQAGADGLFPADGMTVVRVADDCFKRV